MTKEKYVLELTITVKLVILTKEVLEETDLLDIDAQGKKMQ